MTTPTKIALLILAVLGLLILLKDRAPNEESLGDFVGNLFEEYELITEIHQAESPEERTRLINKLEEMPEKVHSFSSRWLNIHARRDFGAWNESGFDHRRNQTPRDIELLAGAMYGVSDIYNGGFHQFFWNGTGMMAPEMIEWFERAGLAESAEILREAMKVFGKKFPRSREVRMNVLDQIEGETRKEFDPFYKLDQPFYDSIENDGKTLNDYADQWLREVCGIESLHTELPRLK